MQQNMNIELNISESCIEKCKPIKFILDGIELNGEFNFSVNLNKVEEDYTEFAFGTGTIINASGKTHEIFINTTEDLKEGMYLVGQINISKINETHLTEPLMNLTQQDFGECILKIVESSDNPQTEEELKKEYHEIIKKRDIDFYKGIGDGSKRFEGCIFIKDCLITRPMRLGQYQIFPWDGLPCNDEINLVQDYLSKTNVNRLNNTQEMLKNCKQGQPVSIVHFPLIKSDSPEIAGEIMEKEVSILCDLLAVLRDGYPSIFGSLLLDNNTGEFYYKVLHPTYKGNLIGGLISGEDPRYIKNSMDNIKTDIKIQLYLSLYNEARKERRIEFIYFRLWNILEIIARSKNYPNQPLCDWQGNVIKNRRGVDREIPEKNNAKELVFEHIRRIFTSSNIGENCFSQGLQQGLIGEMIPIWYRHRNCVVHGGGCFPNDPNFCDLTLDQFVNCKKANDEIISNKGVRNDFTDGYLNALQETVKIVLSKELN